MVAIRQITQAKRRPVPLPPRPTIPFPQPRPLPAVAHTAVLYERYATTVRSYARGKLWVYGYRGDRVVAADDITSAVFLAWLEHAHAGKPLPPDDDGQHQVAYLLAIAKHRCLDVAMHHTRGQRTERELRTAWRTDVVTVRRFAPLWPSVATLLQLLRVALYCQVNESGASAYERAGMLAAMRHMAAWEARTGTLRHRW
jgi:hypothetical protein